MTPPRHFLSGASALAALLVVALATVTPYAEGQGRPAERRLGVDFGDDGVPGLSFSARDLLDRPGVVDKLRSGLRQSIVMRVWARRSRRDEVVARSARTCSVTYDIWEEAWRVVRRDPTGRTTRRLPDLADVVDRCLVTRRMPVGADADWAPLRGATVRFAVLIELNRPSAATVRRMRRWLTQPGGAGLDRGDAFFGSFVAMFVDRRVGGAEATLGFDSQEVRVP